MHFLHKQIYNLHPRLLAYIASALTIIQIGMAVFLYGRSPETVEWVGWICIWISAVFGWLPIITFRKKGGVPEGKSYVDTTRLVDSGIYAVVRHPQNGTAWLLINLGVILITWHWTTLLLGILSMPVVYVDTFRADLRLIEKFGDPYRRYINRVPRVNFPLGILWLIMKQPETEE
jgi:protein-S-isoprenylcysteine O-methyltransferase Ste14